jgi:hypothetical protein
MVDLTHFKLTTFKISMFDRDGVKKHSKFKIHQI